MNRDMNDAQRSAVETVPAALLEIHQRLLEDGAAWRDDLPVGATRATQAGVEPMTLQRPSGKQRAHDDLPPAPVMPRRDAGLIRGLVASVAILLVVGLLGVVFATFARDRNDTRVVATATPGPLASWSVAPHLTNEPVAPIIAPSDPSVVYEAALTGANGERIFRRSDDSGATWHDLPVPTDSMSGYGLGYLAIWVDPANAQNVMVTLSRQIPPEQNDQLCPTVHATVAFTRQGATTANIPHSGAGGCQLQYFSADGGAHWTGMRFPVSGSVSSGWSASQRTLNLLQSQGTRLYTAIHYRGESGLVRVFVSQDHGATWNLADNGLYAADRNICDFVAAPDSTTLYATTGASDCFQMLTPQPITLWRSDDAGAHWNQIGQLPGTAGRVIAAFKATGQADFTLYAATPDQARSYGVERAWASEDGGRQWNAAPDQGNRGGLDAFLSEPRDGLLIVYDQPSYDQPQIAITQSATGTPTPTPGATHGSNPVKSWRPGEANWRPIAQPIGNVGIVFYTVESYSQHGERSLWAVTGAPNATTHDGMVYSVYVARLS